MHFVAKQPVRIYQPRVGQTTANTMPGGVNFVRGHSEPRPDATRNARVVAKDIAFGAMIRASFDTSPTPTIPVFHCQAQLVRSEAGAQINNTSWNTNPSSWVGGGERFQQPPHSVCCCRGEPMTPPQSLLPPQTRRRWQRWRPREEYIRSFSRRYKNYGRIAEPATWRSPNRMRTLAMFASRM